jgi:hypothetical protein
MLISRGFLNLPKYLFFLGNTQLKVICFLSAMGLFITVGITCHAVSERVLVKRGYFSFWEEADWKCSTWKTNVDFVCVGVDLAYCYASPHSH